MLFETHPKVVPYAPESVVPYGRNNHLFQPLIKISLGRQLWNVVDVIVSIGLLLSIFAKPKIESDK